MLTHSENAEQICNSAGSEEAAKSSGREPDVTINQTRSSGLRQPTRLSEGRVQFLGERSAGPCGSEFLKGK